MCYELRVLTALTQHCAWRAHASCAPRRSVINHCSYEFWPCVKHSAWFVPRLCSINFPINQDLIENESMLMCSIVSKSTAVSSTGVSLHGKSFSHLLHNSSPYVSYVGWIGLRALIISCTFSVVCLFCFAARLQRPPFPKLRYRCCPRFEGFHKGKKEGKKKRAVMLMAVCH